MLHLDKHNPWSLLESEMAQKSVRELEAVGITGDPIDRLRLVCLSRGTTGILDLGRMFRRLDHDGHKHLNEEEFLLGLRETGMEISEDEGNDIFDTFDGESTAGVDVDEFLKAVYPPMSGRKIIIERAFTKMDETGDGELSLDELKRVYNVQYHPLYRSGEKSEETIVNRFLAHFDEGAPDDGHVTREEFFNFYAAVSASIDTDVYFDLMMRQCYNL